MKPDAVGIAYAEGRAEKGYTYQNWGDWIGDRECPKGRKARDAENFLMDSAEGLSLPTAVSWISERPISSTLRTILGNLLGILEQDVGLMAALLYGSSLFRAPDLCHDIDLVIVTRGRQHLSRLVLSVPPLPPLSATLTDAHTLEADLANLDSAGYLLNKFVNPLLPLYGAARIMMWQARALASIAEVAGPTPSALKTWKDEQFPGWCKTHPPNSLPSGTAWEGARALRDLGRSAESRGHFDVYQMLH
jgi:hypothetical protein